jgi:uncharacterized protein (DUF302 family)
MTMKYGFGTTLTMDFEQAIDVVTEALKEEGFGVLTDIDVQATVKKKLGEDMPSYCILGACNPPLAHRALTAEPSIGLLLPCNVVVRQGESGTVHVEFMDPQAVLGLVDKPAVHALAQEIQERLERVLEAVSA